MKLSGLQRYKFHHLFSSKAIAVFEACVIGLVAGVSSVLLNMGVSGLGTWRVQATEHFSAFIVLPLVGAAGGFIAGLLVEKVAPETSGSGIPQVKALLQRIPMAFTLRVALAKLIGGIVALGSGLALGREGPTVQIGAALAGQFNRWIPTSPIHRRQLICAGAGAGLAAAFQAPIAGVLFVIEELLKRVSGITLGAAILACFGASLVSYTWGGHSLDINLTRDCPPTFFSVREIPFYVLLGILCGLAGSLFNEAIIRSLNFNFKFLKLSVSLRVALAGAASGLLVAALPFLYRDNAGLRAILEQGTVGWEVAVIAFGLQFLLTVIAYGSGCPGGLFSPCLTLGAALGYLVGLLSHFSLGYGLPTTFALAGMGAFFSGAIRVPITAIVIVFEMTSDFTLVLPLMVSCVVAWFMGEKVSPGPLYDRLLEWSGGRMSKMHRPKHHLSHIKASEIMQTNYKILSQQMTIEEALKHFFGSHYRGYPVVDDGYLVGILTQTDLLAVSSREVSGSEPIRDIMTPEPVTVNADDSYSHVLELLNTQDMSLLPVTDNGKLLGIITGSDIIRLDLKYGKEHCKPEKEPE